MPYTNIKATSHKISALRNRAPLHSHQEKRGPVAKSPVEFQNNLMLQTDTPKLIFGQDIAAGSSMNRSQSPITPRHEENVKFVNEEWERVRSELNSRDAPQHRNGCVVYVEKNEYYNPEFQPFDLEEYWGKKLLEKALDNKAG